jgi:hypothetical protein
LKFLDTITNGYELAVAPNEAILLNRTNGGFKGRHVSLVIPWFDVKSHNRLPHIVHKRFGEIKCDQYLGSGFCFVCFLCVIRCNTFCLDALCLGIFFLVGTEQIDVLVLFFSFRCGSRGKKGLSGRARSRKRAVLRCI